MKKILTLILAFLILFTAATPVFADYYLEDFNLQRYEWENSLFMEFTDIDSAFLFELYSEKEKYGDNAALTVTDNILGEIVKAEAMMINVTPFELKENVNGEDVIFVGAGYELNYGGPGTKLFFIGYFITYDEDSYNYQGPVIQTSYGNINSDSISDEKITILQSTTEGGMGRQFYDVYLYIDYIEDHGYQLETDFELPDNNGRILDDEDGYIEYSVNNLSGNRDENKITREPYLLDLDSYEKIYKNITPTTYVNDELVYVGSSDHVLGEIEVSEDLEPYVPVHLIAEKWGLYTLAKPRDLTYPDKTQFIGEGYEDEETDYIGADKVILDPEIVFIQVDLDSLESDLVAIYPDENKFYIDLEDYYYLKDGCFIGEDGYLYMTPSDIKDILMLSEDEDGPLGYVDFDREKHEYKFFTRWTNPLNETEIYPLSYEEYIENKKAESMETDEEIADIEVSEIFGDYVNFQSDLVFTDLLSDENGPEIVKNFIESYKYELEQKNLLKNDPREVFKDFDEYMRLKSNISFLMKKDDDLVDEFADYLKKVLNIKQRRDIKAKDFESRKNIGKEIAPGYVPMTEKEVIENFDKLIPKFEIYGVYGNENVDDVKDLVIQGLEFKLLNPEHFLDNTVFSIQRIPQRKLFDKNPFEEIVTFTRDEEMGFLKSRVKGNDKKLRKTHSFKVSWVSTDSGGKEYTSSKTFHFDPRFNYYLKKFESEYKDFLKESNEFAKALITAGKNANVSYKDYIKMTDNFGTDLGCFYVDYSDLPTNNLDELKESHKKMLLQRGFEMSDYLAYSLATESRDYLFGNKFKVQNTKKLVSNIADWTRAYYIQEEMLIDGVKYQIQVETPFRFKSTPSHYVLTIKEKDKNKVFLEVTGSSKRALKSGIIEGEVLKLEGIKLIGQEIYQVIPHIDIKKETEKFLAEQIMDKVDYESIKLLNKYKSTLNLDLKMGDKEIIELPENIKYLKNSNWVIFENQQNRHLYGFSDMENCIKSMDEFINRKE